MNKWELEDLKEKLRYDNLNHLLNRYDCRIRGTYLYIYKAIPVNDFIKLRKEIRNKQRIDNIIVEGEM